MKPTNKNWLLIRYGGLGDSLFLTSAATVLKEQGYDVTIAAPKKHAPMFENLNGFTFIPLVRRSAFLRSVGGTVNLAETEDGHLIPIESMCEQFVSGNPRRPFNITDFGGIIESNSVQPRIGATLNSDYVNTYDMHLAWCGIDPETIEPDKKRPVYNVTEKETEWAKLTFEDLPRPIVMIQPSASAPARTYMRGLNLASNIAESGATVVYWSGRCWQFDGANIEHPEDMDGIRATGALVKECDLVISVDTFVSHLAESLGIKHLTLYSTVPAWTRSKYYKHEITVDCASSYAISKGGSQGCYCHVITNGRCPLQEKDIAQGLDNIDRLALYSLPVQVKMTNGVLPTIKPDDGFIPPQMMPGAIKALQESALNKWNSLRHAESYCIASVDLFDYYKEWQANNEN